MTVLNTISCECSKALPETSGRRQLPTRSTIHRDRRHRANILPCEELALHRSAGYLRLDGATKSAIAIVDTNCVPAILTVSAI